MMAMFKLSLALLFFSKYWSTLHGFAKELWYGGILLKAGDAEPKTSWVITAQKGETDYCHTVPQELGYKLCVLCGAIIAIYQLHKIIHQTLFCRVYQSSSPLSDSLLIKNAFKALARRIGRASSPSSEQSPDHSVALKSTDGLQRKGRPDDHAFDAIANETMGVLSFYIAFLLILGLLSSVIDYSAGASREPTSLPLVSIPFIIGPTLMTVWQVFLYVDATSRDDLHRNMSRKEQLDQVNDQIKQLTNRFDNNNMRLKRLEGGWKDPVSITGQMD